MSVGAIHRDYKDYKAWRQARKAQEAAEKAKKSREIFSSKKKGGVEKCKPPKKAWSPGPRPKSVPKDWIPKPSKKDGGTKWVDPKNDHNWV